MPIDPSVLLYGLQPQARTPYDAADLVDERRLRVQQAREALQQKQQKEYEAKVYDWAIKSNLGPDGQPDIPAVAKALYGVSAPFGDHFMTAVRTGQKQQAETDKLDDDHRGKLTEWAGQAFNNADETNYGDIFGVVSRGAPQLVKQYGLTGNYQQDQGAIGALRSAATSIPEQLKAAEEARNHVIKNEYLTGIAKMFEAEPNLTDDTIARVAGDFRHKYGMGVTDYQTVMNLDTAKAKQWAADLLHPTTQYQKDTLAETQRQNDLQEAARQRADADRKAAAEAKAVMDADLLRHRRVIENKPAGGAGAAGADIVLKPGTANYRQAQDLADGTLTFQDFQRLHSRAQADAPLRAAIYDTARTLNPNFNPAAFEIGYRYASNPKVKSQIGSIKNVESGVPDLLKASDAATRSGATMLNQYAVRPIQLAVGSKPYTNFKTAITAFADELSGALGYGSATDMSREMGYDMTDMNQSPANFRSNVEDIVMPFVARKKASILGQMGPYADTAATAGKVVSLSELQAIAKRKGTTVEQEKARATAAGYTVK